MQNKIHVFNVFAYLPEVVFKISVFNKHHNYPKVSILKELENPLFLVCRLKINFMTHFKRSKNTNTPKYKHDNLALSTLNYNLKPNNYEAIIKIKLYLDDWKLSETKKSTRMSQLTCH